MTAADADPAAAAEGVADPFGLTPRERQVLALLAEGATNRQIGAALYMAEKTASVHVSRILAKLGVQGRTQAAAVGAPAAPGVAVRALACRSGRGDPWALGAQREQRSTVALEGGLAAIAARS